MLTYNFSYPQHQQDTSHAHHWSYDTPNSSGNTLIVNLSISDLCCNEDEDSKIKNEDKKIDKGKKDEEEAENAEVEAQKAIEKAENAKAEAENAKAEAQKAIVEAQKAIEEAAKTKGAGEDTGGADQETIINRVTPSKCRYDSNGVNMGFNTYDLLKAWHPEMYSNSRIVERLEAAKHPYGAVNFKFAFTELLKGSWAEDSNMECIKCIDHPNMLSCKDDKIQTVCSPEGKHKYADLNHRFFTPRLCPNLIVESDSSVATTAKQVSPLILVDSSGEMIGKDGKSTREKYDSLKPYLNADGHIRDCADNDATCKKYAKIMEKVAWHSNKELLLKPSHNTEKTNAYSHDTEDQGTPVSTESNFM